MKHTKGNIKIKFPTGKVGHELGHFMGANDYHPEEKPPHARTLIEKLHKNLNLCLTIDELKQLENDCDTALDILADHLDQDGEWTNLHHYHLQKFNNKVNIAIQKATK